MEIKKHVIRRRHLSTASSEKTKLNKIVAMIVGEYLKGTRNRLPIDNPPGRSSSSYVCEPYTHVHDHTGTNGCGLSVRLFTEKYLSELHGCHINDL